MAIKIEAAARLMANDAPVSLKSLIGIDGEITHLTENSSTFTLDKPATQTTVGEISHRLRRVPKHGRRGDTAVYVWEFSADMAMVLYIPPTGKSTIEIYDK